MSSDSEYDENASEQQLEEDKNGVEDKPSTSNEVANGDESDKPASWEDLVSAGNAFLSLYKSIS